MNEFWTCVIILCLIALFELFHWGRTEYRKWKARKKLQSSKPVEPIDWIIYDNTGKKI